MAGRSFLSRGVWRSGRGLDEAATSERNSLWLLIATVLGVLFVLYLLAVWYDWVPDLRGWGDYPQGWTWPLYPLPSWERFLSVITIMAAMWVVVTLVEMSSYARKAAGLPGNRSVRAGYLLMMVLLGYALQLSLLDLKSNDGNGLLFQRVTSRVFTSYFTLAASAQSADAFFSDYPDVFNTRTCPHCQSHPPGPALHYWLSIQAVRTLPADWRATLAGYVRWLVGSDQATLDAQSGLTNSQVVGAFLGGSLILLLAAAIVIPLYGLARHLGPPGWEFRLSALGAVLPGMALMAPQFDQVLGTITAIALYLTVRGLMEEDGLGIAIWGAATGVMIALGIYLSWSVLIIIGLLVALCIICLLFSRRMLVVEQQDDPKLNLGQSLIWLLSVFFGAGVPLLLVALAGQTDLVAIFNHNLANQVQAEAQRPYSVWVVRGPVDFLQFLGLPVALAALWALRVPPWRRFSPAVKLDDTAPAGVRAAFRVPWYARINPYAWLFWGVLLAIDISGRTKAEQGRLLIFLMPVALAGVYLWAGRARPPAWVISALFFAELAVCVVIGARWFVP